MCELRNKYATSSVTEQDDDKTASKLLIHQPIHTNRLLEQAVRIAVDNNWIRKRSFLPGDFSRTSRAVIAACASIGGADAEKQ